MKLDPEFTRGFSMVSTSVVHDERKSIGMRRRVRDFIGEKIRNL
jgi:hypothetical protein